MKFQPNTPLVFALPRPLVIAGRTTPLWIEVKVVTCNLPLIVVREDVTKALLVIENVGDDYVLPHGNDAVPLRKLSMREFEELLGVWTIHGLDGSKRIKPAPVKEQKP